MLEDVRFDSLGGRRRDGWDIIRNTGWVGRRSLFSHSARTETGDRSVGRQVVRSVGGIADGIAGIYTWDGSRRPPFDTALGN